MIIIIALIQQLEDYIEKRKGRLITTFRNHTDNMKINIGNNQKTNIGRKTDQWRF